MTTEHVLVSERQGTVDKIVVIGGKGSAVVLAEQIYDAQVKSGQMELLGFAFDDESFGGEINGFPVLCGTREAWPKYADNPEVKFLFQLYRMDLLKERIELRDSYGIPLNRFAKFIHPSAYVSRSAKIGYGTVVLANSVVNTNAILGNFVTLQSGVLIGHDTRVDDNSFIAAQSAIGSNSHVGSGCFLGLHSTVNNFTSIGNYAFVGMGANVVKSVESGALVYGNPAKPADRSKLERRNHI